VAEARTTEEDDDADVFVNERTGRVIKNKDYLNDLRTAGELLHYTADQYRARKNQRRAEMFDANGKRLTNLPSRLLGVVARIEKNRGQGDCFPELIKQALEELGEHVDVCAVRAIVAFGLSDESLREWMMLSGCCPEFECLQNACGSLEMARSIIMQEGNRDVFAPYYFENAGIALVEAQYGICVVVIDDTRGAIIKRKYGCDPRDPACRGVVFVRLKGVHFELLRISGRRLVPVAEALTLPPFAPETFA
jgi:hypothetical protein